MENLPPSALAPLSERAVERALAGRQQAYRQEVVRLAEAARAIAAETGSLEPKVSEIVSRSGLSNQAFYRHFRSRDELMLAVLDQGLRELTEYLGRRMEGAHEPVAKIRRWVEGVAAQATDPEAARATRPFVAGSAYLIERFPEEASRSARSLVEPLRAAIEEAVSAGQLASADPERDAAAIFELAMGWMQRQLRANTAPSATDVEHLVDFCVRGLERKRSGDGT